LSLFGLAKITDLSKSYLNEIEKAKNTKTDKIILLAEKLEFHNMVSLKLDNNLALIEILKSGNSKEIPWIFRNTENDLIDIIANAPAVNASLEAAPSPPIPAHQGLRN
jgi:hypothetical protein